MTKISTADVQHEIESRLDGLKSVVTDKAGVVKDTAIDGFDFLTVQIKKHPVAAVAIAFGVGYLAMRLMRR